MTISEAIKILTELQKKYDNVQVAMDCPFCGKSNEVNKIEVGPPVAKLK